nr:MAG TPA: major capsid protein [Caudoviricetes sp.]
MKTMNRLQEIEQRLAAIRTECMNEGADLDALTTEANSLVEERRALLNQQNDSAERRRALLAAIANGTAGAGNVAPGAATESRHAYTNASPEYRDAFFAYISGRNMSTEQRAAFDNVNREVRAAFVGTTTTEAAAMPKQTLNEIWDLMAEQHSILNDVTILRTGVVIKVVKRTAIAQGKGKKVNEGAANDDFKDTKVAVELTGNDFSATCTLSYAAATMSIDALEAFIVQDMADQVGNAMAADLMTTIKGAINSANKLTATSTTVFTFAELCSLFGSLKRCRRMVAYVNNATLYKQLVALVDAQGRPIFQQTAQEGAQGAIIGAVIHLEDEAGDGCIVVGDPSRVRYNMVQDVMVETDKDIKNHEYIYSGYARGEGALIDDQSFAMLSLKTG